MMSDVMKLLLELRGKLQFFEGKYVTVEKPEDIADIEQIDVKKDIYNIDLLLSTERTIPVSVEPIDDELIFSTKSFQDFDKVVKVKGAV